jgi:hypothetical protein
MPATYPNGIFQWVPRIDQSSTAFAKDPNTLATEVQAVEATVGVTPQIESSPPAGSAVTFATMSARLSASMNNQLLPVCAMTNTAGFFINAGQQLFNSYTQNYDPYKIWNGQDGTIPVNGWWVIRADQRWNQKGNKFNGQNILFLYLNGAWIDMQIWDWSTAIAANNYKYPANVLQSNGWSQICWEGLLHKGDRVQILSANGTFCPGIQVTNCTLKLACMQTIPTTVSFKSG